MNLTIDPEFKNLIPPLTSEEYAGLEESILAEGCRDSLVAWHGILIDGHNRYEICEKYGITKLATRVSELIRQGERISKEPAEAKNRYGQTVRFMRYRRA